MMNVNRQDEKLGRSCIHKSWMQCKRYFLSQHFCLVIQYKCLILIVFLLIFMTPLAVNIK